MGGQHFSKYSEVQGGREKPKWGFPQILLFILVRPPLMSARFAYYSLVFENNIILYIVNKALCDIGINQFSIGIMPIPALLVLVLFISQAFVSV